MTAWSRISHGNCFIGRLLWVCVISGGCLFSAVEVRGSIESSFFVIALMQWNWWTFAGTQHQKDSAQKMEIFDTFSRPCWIQFFEYEGTVEGSESHQLRIFSVILEKENFWKLRCFAHHWAWIMCYYLYACVNLRFSSTMPTCLCPCVCYGQASYVMPQESLAKSEGSQASKSF